MYGIIKKCLLDLIIQNQILLHVVLKTENIKQVLWMISIMMKAEAEAKSNGETVQTDQTNLNETNAIYKTKNFYLLLVFLSITIALLRVVSIYRYLVKY